MTPDAAPSTEVDVCLVVEGCYPFIAGGVSTWIDWLIRQQPETTFGVVALVADERPRTPKFEMPRNLVYLETVPLSRTCRKPTGWDLECDPDSLVGTMCEVLGDGDPAAFIRLAADLSAPMRRRTLFWARPGPPPDVDELLGSRRLWQVMIGCYQRLCPSASFPDFFWAWRTLVGGLFAVLTARVPRARIYHAISTGYAGLFAARAALATCRPAAITEHGIYTNERRIDLIMADWIADVVDTGLCVGDPRTDIRNFWINTFEAYARITYAIAARVTTLYGANQQFQTALGAAADKLEVIPNGIELARFEKLPGRQPGEPPTVALLGRVVPIKDIAAFIAAAAIVRRHVPDVVVLIMGPTDEDPAYFAECCGAVAELGLQDTVRFTGKVDILQALPTIDVLCLTSISEAQPLSLLEAGAARVPCVATDVGSCRDIIEGTPDEVPPLGPGGRVVPPMDAEAIALAVVELLNDKALRRRCAEALRARVEGYFTSEASAARYARLYRELTAE
jgi:glycosyltransferase involved in cell wall biosynthesis